VNDGPEPVAGQLEVALVARGAAVVERAEVAVDVPARGAVTVGAEEVLGGWRDVTYAYRFAPPAHDAVVATLRARDAAAGDAACEPLAEVVHLPLGQDRPLEADLGLEAAARRDADGRWWVDVRTRRLAQWVTVRAEGFVPADSWFHLAPGARRVVELWPERGDGATAPDGPPRGTVQALNATGSAPITAIATAIVTAIVTEVAR
jgi:beta-mannosidase